jgi:transposase
MIKWAGRRTVRKLKLVERQLYGRAKIDLFEAHLFGAR